MNSRLLSLALSGVCFASFPLNCNGSEQNLAYDKRVEIDIFNLDASEHEYINRSKLNSAINKLRKYLIDMNLGKVLDLKLRGNEYLCGYYGKGTTIFVMNDVANDKKSMDDKMPMAIVGHLVGDDTFVIDTFYCYYQIIQQINDPDCKKSGNCPDPRSDMPEDWIIDQCVMFCDNFSKAWQYSTFCSGKGKKIVSSIDYDSAKAFCKKVSKVNERHVRLFFETFLSRHKNIKCIVLPDTNPIRTVQMCYSPLDLICKVLRTLGFNKSGFNNKDKFWFLSY